MNKQVLILTLLGAALIGSAVFLSAKNNELQQEAPVDAEIVRLWTQWKKEQNKKFADPDFEQYRMQVFADNYSVVKADKSGTFGITKFFDLTNEEFASVYLNEKISVADAKEPVAKDIPVSKSININWVTANKVTAVKNQGACGSCWTFSATGAVESALIIGKKAEQTIDLSEQQLVDCCTKEYDNAGCNGGNKDQAFKYIQQNFITTEQNYPYTAVDGKCSQEKLAVLPHYNISGYAQVKASTHELAKALKKQPIAISVDATNWKFYTNGIFSDCNNDSHNHAVLLVGLQEGSWIVKNSWGPNWGENGYIRLKNGNTCGLANVPYYPKA